MTTQSSTSLAQQAAPRKDFKSLVVSEQFQVQLASALPKHLTPDRFTRVLLTATLKTPLLLQCSQESMFKGILDAAAAGVEIDGRRAHLIPYRNGKSGGYDAQLIIDYKGIAELAMRSGVVATIHADVVCEADEFEFNMGQVTKHKIDLKKPRGKMYAAYALICMKDGTTKAEVMSKDEIDRIRGRSRASGSGPWVTDYDEMAKKTVFRRASKWIPLSPEIRTAVEADDEVAEPVNVTPPPSLASILQAPAVEAPPPAAPIEVPSEPVAEETNTVPPPDVPPAKAYTPEDREQILREVEEKMLGCQVSESRIMKHVRDTKRAKEGQDEIQALDTAVLDALRGEIEILKKGGAK